MTVFRAQFNAHELASAIKSAARVQGRSKTLPVLQGALLRVSSGGASAVTCTNLEQRLSLDVEPLDVEEAGECVLPAQRVRKTLAALPPGADVDVSVDAEGGLTLATEQGTYQIHAWHPQDFPNSSAGDAIMLSTTHYSYDASVWHEALGRVAFAMSGDALRLAMMGALLQPDEGRVVATDGHRLVTDLMAPNEMAGQLEEDLILHAEAVQASLRVFPKSDAEVDVVVTDGHVRMTCEGAQLTSRRINETYPDWQTVMPDDNDHSITVDRERLLAAVKRVGLYSSAISNQIRLKIEGQGARATMTIQAEHLEANAEAQESMSVAWDRPADKYEPLYRIGFNASYLSEVLSHLSGDEVRITMGSPNRAVIATGSGDAKMLVMPVNLNSYQA